MKESSVNLEHSVVGMCLLSNKSILWLYGDYPQFCARIFQRPIDSKRIHYIDMQKSKKLSVRKSLTRTFTNATMLQKKKKIQAAKEAAKGKADNIYYIRPRRRGPSEKTRKRKSRSARRSFAEKRRYYHNNGRSHHLFLRSDVPRRCSIFPLKRYSGVRTGPPSLLLIAAACTFTNLKW